MLGDVLTHVYVDSQLLNRWRCFYVRSLQQNGEHILLWSSSSCHAWPLPMKVATAASIYAIFKFSIPKPALDALKTVYVCFQCFQCLRLVLFGCDCGVVLCSKSLWPDPLKRMTNWHSLVNRTLLDISRTNTQYTSLYITWSYIIFR